MQEIIKTVHDNNVKLLGDYRIPTLPLVFNFSQVDILSLITNARSALAELKGFAKTVPNESILIHTLSLQEAKDSSEIENIITTQDELFQNKINQGVFTSSAAKEVNDYDHALLHGFRAVRDNQLITNNLMKEIQSRLIKNNAGFRTQAGTKIINQQSGEIVYIPPQLEAEIIAYMSNLEKFINEDSLDSFDPLVKMAIIHHQFESIHPFYDGNGRTGRVVNILYLVKQGLLDSPVLYLSRYINQNKARYYELLQEVRDSENWKDWVVFILQGIEQTAKHAIELIKSIKELMQTDKQLIKEKLPKIYSQDLLNHIFNYPYTKTLFLEKTLSKHRNTAIKYLKSLVEIGVMDELKIGREKYYLNKSLYSLLASVGETPMKDMFY